jgi:hypothetical protein
MKLSACLCLTRSRRNVGSSMRLQHSADSWIKKAAACKHDAAEHNHHPDLHIYIWSTTHDESHKPPAMAPYASCTNCQRHACRITQGQPCAASLCYSPTNTESQHAAHTIAHLLRRDKALDLVLRCRCSHMHAVMSLVASCGAHGAPQTVKHKQQQATAYRRQCEVKQQRVQSSNAYAHKQHNSFDR